MKKGLYIIGLIVMLSCSGCTLNGDSNDQKSAEKLDFQETGKAYTGSVTELNDIERIDINEDKTQGVFYYVDAQGYLVPVMRQMPKQEGIAKSMIEALVNNEENRVDLKKIGLSPMLPEDLQFELALKEGGLMRISFNDAINSFSSKKEEETALQAIVYTLTEFETVEKVQVLVNNQMVEQLTHGTKVSEPLTRQNINAMDNIVEGEYIKCTFYFYNNVTDNYTYYIPVTKNIPKERTEVGHIIEEQINLMKEKNVAMPEGFDVENVSIEGKMVRITIKQTIDTESNECKRLMKCLCLTLGQNSDVEGITLSQGSQDLESYTMEPFANVY